MLSGGHGQAERHRQRRRPRPFSVTIFHSGGTGARPGKDGLSATAFPSGVKNTPVEITETVAPLVFRRKELQARLRGRRAITAAAMARRSRSPTPRRRPSPSSLSSTASSIRHAAAAGGGAGARRAVSRWAAASRLRRQGQADRCPSGDSLLLDLPGGGGLGDPGRARRKTSLAEERRKGLVLIEIRRLIGAELARYQGVFRIPEGPCWTTHPTDCWGTEDHRSRHRGGTPRRRLAAVHDLRSRRAPHSGEAWATWAFCESRATRDTSPGISERKEVARCISAQLDAALVIQAFSRLGDRLQPAAEPSRFHGDDQRVDRDPPATVKP